jgi:hypothetical protein
MGDALIIYEEEANKFDAKGNVIEKITKSIDFSTDEFGLDSRITSKYNAQNQLTEELTEVWVSNAAPQPEFRKRSLLTYKYNAKGAIAYSINYQDWNTVVWEAKDSTHIQYNAAGKEIGSITYTFDEDEKKYFLDAKNIKLFDKDGNVSFDKNYEVVDSGTLLSSSLALSWWSLYKDAVAANDIFSTDYQLITANPMQDGQAVTVATKHEGTYQLVAFDITGKIVSRQTVTNNQTVSANLPNTGNYLLILMDKKDKPLAMKKVVKM